MSYIKSFIIRNFTSFTYFYRHLRHRIFIAVGLSILVGVLDGFGLAMFLPVLQLADGSTGVDPEGLGNLRFLVDGMAGLGIPLSLLPILGVLCLFFLLKGIMKFIGDSYRVMVQQYFIRRLRLSLVDALNKISFKSFVTSDAGRIQNTMTGEADRVMRAYQFYFRSFEQSILVAVYMGFAFFVDVRFAVLVTVGGILTNLLYQIIYRKTKNASRRLTRDSHAYQGLVIQHVGQFKYLKATGLLHRFGKKLKQSIFDIELNNKKIGIYGALLTAAREPLLIFVVAGVIILQTVVLDAALAPILISLLFFYRALTALIAMQNTWNGYLSVAGSMENMTDYFNDLTEKKEQTGTRSEYTFVKSIELKQASFYYGNTLILKDIDLKVEKHKTTAFVGESGSGKTTLVSMLGGLFRPDQGSMLIDGQDVGDLNLGDFQSRIGFITQDPVIFNDSIFNNVTFWDTDNEEHRDKFWEALRQASVDHFVLGLEEKEDTVLGQNGINLSGGQKQRLAIARELYKYPEILIMDEATSALDSETERDIQKNIDLLKGQYTILIIAHRLSTIRNADRVVMLNQGRIERIGTYQDLVNQSDSFKRMVALQEL